MATRSHDPQLHWGGAALPSFGGGWHWVLGNLSRKVPRLLVLAAVALVVAMAGTITGLLSRTTASQASPPNAAAGAPLGSAAPKPGPPVVVVGDSHAWQWALHNAALVDLGVPGITSKQILPHVTEALALHPRTVVVSAGTNDLVQGVGWAPVASNIEAMVNQIKAAGAQPVVLLIPDFHAGMKTAVWAQMGLGFGSAAVVPMPHADQIPALNTAIRALGVPLLQAPAGETFDGVHLDGAAYASLNQQLADLTG